MTMHLSAKLLVSLNRLINFHIIKVDFVAISTTLVIKKKGWHTGNVSALHSEQFILAICFYHQSIQPPSDITHIVRVKKVC
jgi:hypothetical protein